MRFVRSLPPFVVRTLATGAAGSLLLVLGWHSLGGNDAGSALMAFPLMSIGATLAMISLGAGGIALRRLTRGEPLSPLPVDPDVIPRAPLPRAVARPRR